MKRHAIAVAVALLAGLAAARWFSEAAAPGPSAAPAPAAAGFDRNRPLADRVAALERAVGAEREARQLLEEEVIYLHRELAAADYEDPPDGAASAATEAGAADVDRRRGRRRDLSEARRDRLIAAGFAADRADWILRRESRLQLAALEARYAAERGGEWDAYRDARRAQAATLRAELGEEDYEKYLAARGRPPAGTVAGVMDSSPAQRAGLRPGDRILRYGGERIYSLSELNRAVLAGEPGETVLVDFRRDGVVQQVAMPRGPLGIMGNRRSRAR